MQPKLVKQVLHDALNADGARVNLYLWGKAGIGKSAVTLQVTEEAGVDFLDVRASQLDPTDVRGIIIPDMVNKTATWLTPEWLPKNPDWKGIIFLDEMNLAPILVQSAFYQLIWDRQIGEYELPKGAMIVAAGNRKQDGAPAHNMAAPLRNRFCHILFEASIKDWNDWAMQHNISPDVIAFLNFKVEVFSPDFKPNAEESAFPSPRAWEFVSRIMAQDANGKHYYSQHPDSLSELVAGCVGVGAAAEFSAFVRVREQLPDADAILAGNFPKGKAITQPDILYALMTTLAVKSTQMDVAKRPTAYGNLLNYLEKIESAEFHTLCIHLIAAKDRENLSKTPEWGKWIKKHKDVFMKGGS
jgi:hypothetical protein